MPSLSPKADRDRYAVSMEVAGSLAMYARPDTGGTPTSYPVPTWSAAKGLLESIAYFSDGAAWICPTRIEVCRRIGDVGGKVNYQPFTTNYGGPLRKPAIMNRGITAGGSSMQVFATAIANPCYRIYGVVLGNGQKGGINRRHHLQDLFNRRIMRGQCFRTPRLGWSECVCNYWGPFRNDVTEVDDALSLDVPAMLISMWSQPTSGEYSPRFAQNAQIVHGVLEYELAADVKMVSA